MTHLIVLAVALGLCPDPSRHEGARDCPWAAIARAAQTGDAGRVLAEDAPRIWKDVSSDRRAVALVGAWADSRNFDEHAKAPIVAPAIVTALSKAMGVLASGDVVHAGLMHTYGYLFSTLWTPFGYKRARWVDGELERGLHLPDGILGPTPRSGTLFANVTCVLAGLAFDGPPGKELARDCALFAAPEIKLALVAPHETWREHVRDVTLKTDLFALSPGHYLLVYSMERDGRQGLLTSFPVDEQMARSLRAQPTGDAVPIVARYNAAVRGLDMPTTGSRRYLSGK